METRLDAHPKPPIRTKPRDSTNFLKTRSEADRYPNRAEEILKKP